MTGSRRRRAGGSQRQREGGSADAYREHSMCALRVGSGGRPSPDLPSDTCRDAIGVVHCSYNAHYPASVTLPRVHRHCPSPDRGQYVDRQFIIVLLALPACLPSAGSMPIGSTPNGEEERLLDRDLPWHHWRLPCNAGEWCTTNLGRNAYLLSMFLLRPTYRTAGTHSTTRFGSLC